MTFDDGVVVGRATAGSKPVLLAAQEGKFNGGALGEATALVEDEVAAFRAGVLACLGRQGHAPADLASLQAAQAALEGRRETFPAARDGLEIWRGLGLPDPEGVPMLEAAAFNQQLIAVEARP